MYPTQGVIRHQKTIASDGLEQGSANLLRSQSHLGSISTKSNAMKAATDCNRVNSKKVFTINLSQKAEFQYTLPASHLFNKSVLQKNRQKSRRLPVPGLETASKFASLGSVFQIMN